MKNERNKKKFIKKEYINEIIEFFNKRLKKKTLILMFIMIIFSALFIMTIIKMNLRLNNEGIHLDSKITLLSFFMNKTIILLMTMFAGTVPFIYLPVMAGFFYMYQTLIDSSYIVLNRGFFLGSILICIPLLIDIISISLTVAIGIYLCKTNTNKYIISQQRNMNFNKLMLNLHQITKNKEKEKKIQNKIDDKEKKIQNLEVKINYKQIINITTIVIIFQMISSIIEYIFI